MGPGETIALLIAIGFPSLFLIYLTRRWFALKEKASLAFFPCIRTDWYGARDAQLRSQMRIEIRSLQQRLKTTTVYVTHD